MTLRKITLIIVGLTIAGLIAILFITSRMILLGSATRLEEQGVRNELKRAQQALAGELSNLQTFAASWAAWDDTGEFIRHPDSSFVDANFNDEAFTGLRLSLLVLVDSSGRAVFAKTFSLAEKQAVPVSPGLVDSILADPAVVRHASVDSVHKGIFMSPSGPILLASLPVVGSAGTGPIYGTLIVGRSFDAEEIQRLSSTLHLALAVAVDGDPKLPADFQRARGLLSPSNPVVVQPVTDQTLAGYAEVTDIAGRPTLTLRVESPAAIYAQSQTNLRSFIIAIAIVGPLFGGLTLILLEKLVLSRLARLSANVEYIGASGKPGERVTMSGRDELASLGGTINGMLEALERSGEDVRRAYAQNQQLLTAITSILLAIDASDRITHWNGAAEDAFGLAAGDVTGQTFWGCGVRWDWARLAENARLCRSEKRPVRLIDFRYTRPDGKDGFLEISINPFDGHMDAVPGLLFLCEDVTQRKVMEAQLGEAQKLRAIGQLAAGIAHEINTPSQYVADNVLFLQDAFTDLRPVLETSLVLNDDEASEVRPDVIARLSSAAASADLGFYLEEVPAALERAQEGMIRVSQIVHAMRDFSHPGSKDKEPTDLNRCIASTITVARNEYKRVADLVADFDPDLPPVVCLPGEFNQVVLNLIVNAAHAIGDAIGPSAREKGTITVSTRRSGDWVEIRVKDTGTGIPEAIRSRVFEPFFTTKAVGVGTGQGLALAHNVIVEHHGGTIGFETAQGHGTTFVIRLPLRNEPSMIEA